VRRVSPAFCIFHTDLDASLADRILYSPERLLTIATEAPKLNSAFSLGDHIGLVHDAITLGKAGHLRASASLALVDAWRSEDTHLVWEGSINSVGCVVFLCLLSARVYPRPLLTVVSCAAGR
jgi:hypothetical protein